ncbi:hypothetical protein [Inediibacterium massiliense]|uniref:nSTAND3 domain-containing NTPase n=1 Tax=Inediibacterium massiliense TaxID=1658111 RepID=UPI0018FF0467|nr:hypothetical protein [Inediibacterium massiliense]
MRDDNILISGGISRINNNYIFKFGSESMKQYSDSFITNKIEKLKKYFTETLQYERAIAELQHSNAVMFIGCSGIGKTDTSIMVANNFIENYKVKFIRCPNENELQNICYLMDQKTEEKEVWIFNDFLGDTKLNNSKFYFDKLEELLKNIEFYSNKKFIFNSRKTIFQDAKVYSEKFNKLIQSNVTIFDLEKWTRNEDKINILIKYCDKNKILNKMKELLEQKLWTNKIIENILDHSNFSPLIIKEATKVCSKVNISDYETIFLRYLNNPKDV